MFQVRRYLVAGSVVSVARAANFHQGAAEPALNTDSGEQDKKGSAVSSLQLPDETISFLGYPSLVFSGL